MKVSASDKGTGKSNSVTITNDKGRLSPEDIERMVADAERFAEEDELVKKNIESRNALENLAYSLKGQLADQEGLGGKLDGADKKEVEAEIKKVQDWLDEHGASASAEDFDERRRRRRRLGLVLARRALSSSRACPGGFGDGLLERARGGSSAEVGGVQKQGAQPQRDLSFFRVHFSVCVSARARARDQEVRARESEAREKEGDEGAIATTTTWRALQQLDGAAATTGCSS